MPSDTRFLQRIGSRWYARIPVPSKLRPHLGPYIRKTLKTSDIAEAQKRRWDAMEWARRKIEDKARELGLGPPRKAPPVPDSYEAFRAKLGELGPAHIVIDPDMGEEPNPALEDYVDSVRMRGRLTPTLEDALGDYVEGAVVVSELLSDYLAKNPKRSATTKANYETTVKLWIAHHGDRPIHRVTRKQAIDWIEDVGTGKARDTVKRYVTVMSHLFDWSWRRHDIPPANPFERLQKAAGKIGRDGDSYGVFEADELVRVFAALEDDPELKATALISLYSGMRLAECLRAKRVEHGGILCFELEGGKTVNAKRIIPVHPRLRDVYAPEGLSAPLLTTRFVRVGKSLELPKGKVFHSFRKCFATALERASVPTPILDRLMGHTPSSLALKKYAFGREAEELRGWVERVNFPV